MRFPILVILGLAVRLAAGGDGTTAADRPAQLRRAGAAEAEIAAVTGLLHRVAGDGLPIAFLETKLDEGLAKGVASGALQKALEARVARIRQARDMAGRAGYTQPPVGRSGGLWEALALALESGVPEADLTAGLASGGGRRMQRVCTAVNGGESLALAGIPLPLIREAMLGFLDRDISRRQMLGAVTAAVAVHRKGGDATAIRTALANPPDTPPEDGHLCPRPASGRGDRATE